jgi:protein O-mannosyl-transferase
MRMARESHKVKKKSAQKPAHRAERAQTNQFSLPSARRLAFFCVLLSALTFALYWPVLAHPFADYDDDTYVTANANVRSGLNQHSLIWALTSTEKSNWHPLTWISHELDCQIYGLNPKGHHFTNLGLHVVNVVLLFLVLVFATGAAARSFLVALLFAIHPLNVESVAWVAERKNVLSTVFFLLAIGAYCWYARKPAGKRYALVFVMFLLGLASKPMVITLPFVLLLFDYWPLQRVLGATPYALSAPAPQFRWLRLVLEKVPLFLLSVGSAVATIFAQGGGGSIKSLADMPIGVRVKNAICAYAEYFLKVWWPSGLAPHYPHPGSALALWKVLTAAVFLLGISAFIWKSSRSY